MFFLSSGGAENSSIKCKASERISQMKKHQKELFFFGGYVVHLYACVFKTFHVFQSFTSVEFGAQRELNMLLAALVTFNCLFHLKERDVVYTCLCKHFGHEML